MFPKIRANPWIKGLQFPECVGRRENNHPPNNHPPITWQPSGQGLMATVIWDLGSKAVTQARTAGPTSPRNQVVRKPKRTASLASRSYQGTPMLHVSHSSPFQRSRAQAEAPTSRSTTRGPPSISQRPKYTCRGNTGRLKVLATCLCSQHLCFSHPQADVRAHSLGSSTFFFFTCC